MKAAKILLALLLTALLAGCVARGAPLSAERVKSIIPGKSTKGDVLGMFGAPVSIAVQNEMLAVPRPASMISAFSGTGALLPGGATYRLGADTFFALFPTATEYHRVYYFYRSVSYRYPVFYLVYFGENGWAKTDRLWVLVEERTGIVEDYAFKKYGQDTVFGRTAQIKEGAVPGGAR